jgi:HEAT repeat protein
LSLLAWFWLVSWSVCGLAVAILAGLVAARFLANRRADARRLERARFIELIKARAERPDGAAGAGDVLTDLAVELLELVRGDERTLMADRAAKAGAAERLRERLRRGGARARILAASALADFGDEDTRAVLVRALDDRNPQVRLTAALSLAATGQAPPPRDVIRRLGIGDRETSLLAVMLLAEMARTDPDPVRALLRDAEIAPTVRAAAAEALAMCDDFAAVPIVAGLAIEANPEASELPRYLSALAEIEHPAGAPAILHCLDSPSAEVRAAAARAAGRIGVAPALDRLERLLGDPGWRVRFEAARALLRLGEEGAKRLCRAARGGEGPARETAALMLAEQAAPR